MRQQVKRYSRSALSILLTFCMIVSMVAVSQITTFAAQENIRAYSTQANDVYLVGGFNNWVQNDAWKLTKDDNNHYYGTFTISGASSYEFKLSTDGELYSIDDSGNYNFTTSWDGTSTNGNQRILINKNNMKITTGTTSARTIIVDLWESYGDQDGSKLTVKIYEMYLGYGINNNNPQNFTWVSPTASGSNYTYDFSSVLSSMKGKTCYFALSTTNGYAGMYGSNSVTVTGSGSGVSNPGMQDFNVGGTPTYFAKANISSGATSLTVTAANTRKAYTINADASVTVNTTVTPSGVGTAYVSNSSNVGTDASVSVGIGSNVYLKATVIDSDYEFSSWKAVSGLEYESPGSNTTKAKATADATATAIFLPKKYGITKQNSTHIKVNVPTEARWGSSVTPTATAEPGYKVDKFQWWDGSEWHDLTPGSSFTMPKHDVIVKAVETTCATHTVTFSTTTGNGSIRAVTDDGRTITSGGLVNTGSVVTFTAVPADEATFTSWGGDLSGSVSPKSLTVNADKNVTASFGDNAYFVASYTSSTYNADSSDYSSIAMTRLNNGYYRSSRTIPLNQFFTVGKTAGSTTTYAKCGPNEPWGITTDVPAVIPQHWTSDAKMQSKYQNKIAASYVFFDPETDKIWLSSDPAGFTGVTIFAKDGSLVAQNPGAGTAPGTTCGWGDTTLTVTAGGSNKTVTDVFDSQVHKATLTDAEVQASTTSVTVSTTSSKSGYYVYGFDVNGITIQAENGSATFCPADLDCNISNFIEITPIYMLTDPSLTDPNTKPTTIRFYVRSFAGEIESRWGGELYCYAYENEDIRTNGNWPGQPMINLGGGTYYMDLPINTKGITLSNAAADWVHATTMGIGLPLNNEQQSWDNRNAYQCQSYDYDDFQYIYAKPGVGENDEDIIFDFKYKQGDWGKSGLDNFPDNQFEKQGYSETNFPNNLDPSNPSYQWEEYTDFYGNPVDLWGTRLTSNYNNNPVRIVVQGYYDTTGANSSYYATTYVVYEPDTPTGANPSYSIVKYTSNNMTDYGKLSRSEFLQRSAEDMGLTGLAGQPVEITYEYAIYKNMSTKGTHPINQTNQYAERADGVWYYSETKPVKAKIKIQYADKLYGTYTDDTFEIDTENSGTDYDGDPYTVNEGTVTKGKAYFIDNNGSNANRPLGAPFDVIYTNRTVEFAYSDGNEHYELQAEESPDGEYTFVGWYKETSNGLDKCPPGFTYSMEATTNETFIARYVKAPSGIKLAHKPVVTGNSGGNGNRKVKYEIYNNANLTGNPLKTGEANGSIVVDKKYIKYNQDYYLKVTYEVVPDGNSLPNGIYSTDEQAPENLISEEGFESHNTYNSKHVDVDNFALTPEGRATTNTTKVEFKVPINAFFKQITGTNDYEFDEDLALLELFSDIDRKRNNINITKTVDYNNGETFTINVKEQYVPDPAYPDTKAWRDYEGKYTVGDDTTETNFTGNITISGGQTIHIVDAPAGTVFQISEVDPATDTAYNFYSVTITGATATDIDNGNGYGKQFTMPNDSPVNMKFTNNIKKADVKVKKVVVDGNSGTQKFPITLTYTAPGAATTTKTVNLGHDETTTGTDILTLPVGTTITVSENLNGISGYAEAYTISGTNISQNGNTFTVTAQPSGTDALITVTNKKLHDVTLTKTTDWTDYDSSFRVQILTSVDGTNYTEYNGNLTGTGYNATTQKTVDVTRTAIQSGSSYYYDIKKSDVLSIPNLSTGTYVKIVETDTTQNYNFNTATVEGEAASTETAISTAPKGVQFQVGTTDAAVTINNLVIRHDVTVTKQTFVKNGDVYTDFPYNDRSTFGVKVLFNLLGNSDLTSYVPITGGKINGSDSDPTDGVYYVEKDGVITFTDIPKGSFIAVSEDDAAITNSNVTKSQRFVFDSTVINSGTEVTGTGSNQNAKYVQVGDTDVSLSVRNIVKQNNITITKTTNNADNTSQHTIQVHVYKNGKDSLTDDDEYTTLNYTSSKIAGPQTVLAGGDITIVGGEKLTFHYPVGSVVTVKETAPNANFDFSSITVTDAAQGVSGIDDPTTVNGLLTFQTKDAVAAVNITNNIKTKNLTITKATNVSSATDAFKIKLYTSTDNTNWAPYTTALKIASGSSTLAPSNSEYTIHKDEQWVMQNIPINTYVKIEESDCNTAAGYTFDGMTGDGVTVDTTNRTGVVQMTADKTVTITNKEDIKYQFEIKYIYESYSAKTYKDNTAHNDDNRVVGANRSYTQKGEISRDDLDTFFDQDAEGKLSFKNNTVRKNFINKFAPYEDDFMLNLRWNDSDPKPATYDAPNKTIRLETKATSETARTVRVKVKMPWRSDGAYDDEPEIKLYTTQYGDHVYDTDGSLLTAPQTLLDDNGTTMYFKYWQIKTDYDNKDTHYSDTNSKRCYYDSFNMTMYQDSYVEAVYGTTGTSFNPSAQSYADTENGEARIAFMETSRNQWNNSGDPVTNKLAGDRIYTDFQLTFGYQDIMLNTAAGTGIKTGFVMEQVALLDKVDGKIVINTESEYKTQYDGNEAQKTERENAVKAYIADKNKSTYTDTLGTHTFKLNSNIALTTLDNKNQCKHSVDMSNKVLRGDNLEEGTLKNYVYRAYTYIQLSDGSIVLSDPVYFTIYDVATINNGTTN